MKINLSKKTKILTLSITGTLIITIIIVLSINSYQKKNLDINETINQQKNSNMSLNNSGENIINDVFTIKSDSDEENLEKDEKNEQQEQEKSNTDEKKTSLVKTSVEKKNNISTVAEAFVKKAVAEIGYGPDENGVTKYGQWYQDNVDGSQKFNTAAWCAMFLSWCANEVGVSRNTVGFYAECSSWMNDFYVKNNIYKSSNEYTPKRGDIIFFDNHYEDKAADHNGIVETVTDSQVIVIEGNVNNKVARCTYNLNDSKILGYGIPNYSNNVSNKKEEKKNVQTSGTQQQTTGQADRIISIAASQLGIGEDANGVSKYGLWYQNNIDSSCYFASSPWCAMFVTWCANQAGVSSDIITPYAYCGYGIQYFKDKGVWHDRSSGYVPKKGDVIFFGTDRHTGLVEYSQNGYVYTIEGNSTNSSVARKSYDLNWSDINGYGSPKYK